MLWSTLTQYLRIDEAYETLRYEFTKDDIDVKSLLHQDGKTSMRDGYFEQRDKGQYP